jgi:hypothetical protein
MVEPVPTQDGKPLTPSQVTRAKIAILALHPGEVDFVWHDSILQTLFSGRHEFTLLTAQSGAHIEIARNQLTKRFLEDTDCDYALWTDVDMMWYPEDVDQLVADDRDIVYGYYLGTDGHQTLFPVAVVKDENGKAVRANMDWVEANAGQIVEIVGTGMAFTLIKRKVYEALSPIRALWPYEVTAVGSLGNEDVRDGDVTFGIRAATAGFKSYIDLGVRVGHRKAVLI